MKRLMLCTLALLLLVIACKKEEFQQAPFGDKVPYTDTATYDLKTLVSMSASHKLFAAAWQRSKADAVLKVQGAQAQFTVLAPDDAAMRAAGYDEATIAATPATEIDSLVLFHIVAMKLDSSALAPTSVSTGMLTVLTHASLLEYQASVGSSVPHWKTYRFRQFMVMDNGHLIVNGKDAGNATPVKATNGTLWPINQVTKRPTKHVRDVLAEDPRTSMISELLSESVTKWELATEGMFAARQYFMAFEPEYGVNVWNDAFFAPTNEAFAKSGFNSTADLWTLNDRSYPYFDWDWYEFHNEFVTDSLLAYHSWGRMYAPRGGWGQGRYAYAPFFARDLKNNLIGDFEVTGAENLGGLKPYKVPLEFGTEGGMVTVKVKGVNKPAAKIIEADIYTYEGPVHLVDHLILSDKVQF